MVTFQTRIEKCSIIRTVIYESCTNPNIPLTESQCLTFAVSQTQIRN